ncbi:hypothetical protein DM02DRAFT_734153 [Periconia macrospinosa]|uniref:Fungal STAND N-terminal Goodbye domain-containing protein n=1 Tax=Periconia macrospinosa TaxID=97972 RepID=A0A2V1D0D8_9PLEO|nr:hypothetical protein DM02DRAFT_734153 [Periconia macrospinosa]
MATVLERPAIAELVKKSSSEFVASLTDEEQALFQATTAAQSLLQDVSAVNEEHKDGSAIRRAFAALQPFIAGVEQYGQALDVFANSNDLLCPIWGSIRIVLHISREFGTYFEKITRMLQDMGETLDKIPRSLRLYPSNQNLHASVRAIFESILEFATKAKNVFRMGRRKLHGKKTMNLVVSLTAALTVLWKPFEVQFGDIKARIAKGVADIETEAELAEKELAQGERIKDNIRWSKMDAANQLTTAYIDDQSWKKVTEWLSPANVATNHNAATKLRHGHSGTWFLESEAFQTWLKDDNAFLWLHAIPGAGKTIHGQPNTLAYNVIAL